MFPQIQNLQSTGTTSYGNKEQAKLGRDDFLKIFLTQLQYQDPLNPMEGTEFTAQLAQFSSLEQLFNINDQLKQLEHVQGKGSKFQALNLIDKIVRAEGDKIYLRNGEEAKGAFDLKGQADCIVLIEDALGSQIRTIPLGILGPGLHDFAWDGKDDKGVQMNQGVYSFRIIAKDGSGQPVPASSRISGKVTGVSIKGESPIIYIGDIPLDMSQVMDISVDQSEEGESSSWYDGVQ